ncbi:MAG: hypothetical protein DI598_08565 [Pseudopedobacter saltans]|uniref:Uncharacterized protein n=1 Tax=Pseudopedobacter saltans TaxID=151895 RepID=A0A2W5F5K1_9SPHI|nr:MAG: hypothetical protein DI598_08565 [Pseudopedobacter saltans]
MFKWLLILVTAFSPMMGITQKISGIWKGYFTTGFGDNKQYYKYEVQILTHPNGLTGVAYSYLNTSFYGKSHLEGYYNESSKKLFANEIKLISFSNTNSSNVCLMHNTLSYLKIGEKETLEGTFTSANSVTGDACSEGYVYLERSTKSDFYTEPFLAKVNSKSITKSKKETKSKTPRQVLAKNTSKPKKLIAEHSSHVEIVNDSIFNAKEKLINTEAFVSTAVEHTNSNTEEITNPIIQSFASIPENFQHRKNKLVKTIITHTPEVDISFYDNGEVDDDTITVYHNLNPIVEHGRLSRQPIDYGFDATENNRLQSFIIVADNLGKIPPNSALMVVYTNNERYEVFIESDLKNNGEVRIIYEPVKKNGKK